VKANKEPRNGTNDHGVHSNGWKFYSSFHSGWKYKWFL